MTKFILFAFLVCMTNFYWSQQDVEVQDSCKLTVPNSVSKNSESSPNGEFIISSNCAITKFSLEIYNRWGNSLFKTTQLTEYWNTSKQESGVYFWMIKYKNAAGKEQALSGYVNVLN